MRVLKWTVPVNDEPVAIGGGRVVHVGSTHLTRANEIHVWTLEENDHTPDRLVQVYGTGMDVPMAYTYLGTTIVANGTFVWHLFEIK